MPDTASPFDRPEPPEGLLGYYSCDHGVSNVPCLCHFATAMLTGDPHPVVQPDDWYHFADGLGGLSDKSNIG